MKTTQIIKTENDYGNQVAYVVTELINIPAVKGFSVRFRSYDISNENGGYETKIWVKNLDVKCFTLALGSLGEVKTAAELMNFQITSHKTNNIVPEMYQYRNFKSNLR